MKYSLGLAPRNPNPVPRSGTHFESGYRKGSLKGVVWRMASPRRGASILITSAPSSAKYEAQEGPRMYCVHDRTRYPFRASGLVNSFLGLNFSWQNSSKLCPFLVAVVAMSVPPAALDYVRL